MPARSTVAFGLAAVVVIGGALLAGWIQRTDLPAGPCAIAGGSARLPEIPESSGLAIGRRNRDVIWSHNDSGNAAVLFALDSAGRLRGRVGLPIRTRDWEDLSAAACPAGNCLFIGDIGDNVMRRTQVDIYRVPEPAAGDTMTAQPVRFAAVYPDGPHNAEAMFVVGDGLFIITKDRTGLLYAGRILESSDRRIELQKIGELGIAVVTDAEASPDGQLVVVRNAREASFYRTADLIAGRTDASVRVAIEGLQQPQGEGVAFDGTMLYLSSEGRPWTFGGSLIGLRCAIPLEASSRVDAPRLR
jgi:hypothetical protein